MLIRKAFKFRAVPTADQEQIFEANANISRYIWNSALALQNHRKERKGPLLFYSSKNNNSLSKELKIAKQEPGFKWLSQAHSQVLQQKLMDLDKAFKRFFEKVKKGEVGSIIAKRKADGKPIKHIPHYPQFKKKGKDDSFRFPQGIEVKGNQVKLPQAGWVRVRKSREIVGKIKNATVSKYNGHWYISIQTEYEVDNPVHPSTKEIGIDLGVAKFAAFSDGSRVESINTFRKHEERLAKAQRKLASKDKFSNNWKKQKAKIAKLHGNIADVRKDFLHKLSTKISKNHAMIVIENLEVRNQSASAKGSNSKPGKKVRQKSGLNKSILDQGWFEFRRQLEYKQKWQGGLLLAIPPHYTSQRCFCCGHVSPNNRLSQAEFACVVCGHQDDADINAAKNILAAGHAVLACESNSIRSRKQEPVGMSNLVPLLVA